MPTKSKVDEAYCVKCRVKVWMEDTCVQELKNGRLANEGYCPNCGTKCYRFIKGYNEEYNS